ncbi:hypothetical protein B0H17DRAFT_1336418 [Mycena rosella]|uniref:Uncharacterized protein n=1 Tax=Mycena rosella TaxID=1033263 RepID=A0AAD7CVH2_MYCRO|nr:hypothetical protein B0H17DRAFT_1336418 [Mycena rosella]
MTPAIPLRADSSPSAWFFTPAPGIFALFTILGVGVPRLNVEDEAITLRITFLAVPPFLLPLMQLVSLFAIARCAYNIRVLKKKIQLIVETRV